jgi:hypothetical protein
MPSHRDQLFIMKFDNTEGEVKTVDKFLNGKRL